ncbi:MAG TPA: flavin reductase family protein [Methanomicrobiales archaeon]|jgi:flavin reductase (DIM6/NTAB) family NADH-FMN oxidoreductase RutF|nr:flavin reductase family protein [Methanomicrobiales archaeon]
MKQSLGARTLLYTHPVVVIGTYDQAGNPNVMTAAWAGICCSSPPCVAVSLQRPRHTHRNIMENRAFTVSIPSEKYVREADFFGMVSGKDTDKFAATGLTPVKGSKVNAPYVGEFPVVLECRLLNSFELGLHTQFVGEILDVKVDEYVMGPDGKPEMGMVRPFIYDSARQEYHAIGRLIGKAFSAGRELKG